MSPKTVFYFLFFYFYFYFLFYVFILCSLAECSLIPLAHSPPGLQRALHCIYRPALILAFNKNMPKPRNPFLFPQCPYHPVAAVLSSAVLLSVLCSSVGAFLSPPLSIPPPPLRQQLPLQLQLLLKYRAGTALYFNISD